MTYKNVNEMFKDICDNLRLKLNTTELIRHDEIAEKIASIPSSNEAPADIVKFSNELTGIGENVQVNSTLNNIAKTICETMESNPDTLYSLRNAFKGCKSTLSAGITFPSSFNRVYDISGIFQNATIKNFNSFIQNLTDTSRVIDMSYSFAGVSISTDNSLDLSNFDTSNVKDMNHMFNQLRIKSINVSNLNTSNVENMDNMFSGCSYVENLDVSNFDTSKVKTMNEMFNSCSNLTTIDVSNFNTSNLEEMTYMFGYCYSLESIDLTKWDDTNIKNVSSIFYNCKALKEVDFSAFSLLNATSFNSVFDVCSSLERVIFSPTLSPKASKLSPFGTSTNQLVDVDMSGNTNFSTYNGTSTFNLATIWRGNTDEYISKFVNFANTLGVCTSTKTRTIKIYTNLYNTLSAEQKALITDKGYTLSYGTS